MPTDNAASVPEVTMTISKSVLDAAARKKIPAGDFAGPDDSYPIHDEAHARDALSRAAASKDPALMEKVRSAVAKKYPNMQVSGLAKSHRMLAAEITRIALCKRGKNGFTTLLKGDGSFCWESLTKAAGENELLTVVYAPGREDDDGHFADAAVIKAACHAYNRDHRELDIEHDGNVLSDKDAYIAESFIVAKGDERFANWKDYGGQPVGDLTGAWASVIKLESTVLQKAYRDGELDGVSMFGQAALERVDTQAASKRVADRLGKSRDAQPETDMELKELQDTLSSFKAEIVTMVKSTVAEAVKPPAPADKKDDAKPDEAPTFKGDATKASDLEAFAAELKAHEINKSIRSGKLTAEQVVALAKSLSAVEPSDEEADVEAGDTAEVISLKRQLFKAKKVRNAPEGSQRQDDSVESIAKASADEGLAIAQLHNERMGSGPSSGMRLVKS